LVQLGGIHVLWITPWETVSRREMNPRSISSASRPKAVRIGRTAHVCAGDDMVCSCRIEDKYDDEHLAVGMLKFSVL
jgi:hypothetical protein